MLKCRDLFCDIYEGEEIKAYLKKVTDAFEASSVAADELHQYENDMPYHDAFEMQQNISDHQYLIDKSEAYSKKAEILHERYLYLLHTGHLPK